MDNCLTNHIKTRNRALELLGFKIVYCRSDIGSGLYPERGYLVYNEEYDTYEINNLNKIGSSDVVLSSHNIYYNEYGDALTEARKEIRLEKRKEIIDKVLGQ